VTAGSLGTPDEPAGEGSSPRGTIARAGLIVTGLFLLSRVFGWVRVSVLAAVFGAGGALDPFYAAFRIPDLIFQLVAAGALSSALIPIVASLLATDSRTRAWRVVSTVTNLMLIALLVLAAVFEVAAPAIVPLITPGFSPAQLAETVELTRIMLLSPILLGLGAVATSVLNAQGRFAASALAPVVYNIGIIGGAVFLAPALGVDGLAIGVVAGSLGHLAIQLRPLVRCGFRYTPEVDTRDPQARQALLLMAPRALGLGVNQVTFVIVTSLASALGAGAITAFNFAFTLLQIPIGVIGVPLGVVVFPSLAREHATGNGGYVSLLARSNRLLLFVMIPITGLAIVLRRQIVTILFDYGRFNVRDTDLIATTLAFLMLGVAAHSALAVLARAFYARQDTRTPVAAAILAVAVNSSLAVLLAGPFGLAGIASSFTVAAWIEAAALLFILRRREPTLNLLSVGRLLLEAAVATTIASGVAQVVLSFVERLVGAGPGKVAMLGETVLVGAAFGLVYVGLAFALRIPELATIVDTLMGILRRPPASSPQPRP